MKAIPIEFCDEKLIVFMREFSQKAIIVQKKQKALDEEKRMEEDIKNNTNQSLEKKQSEKKKLIVEYTISGELIEPSDDCLYFIPTFWKLMQNEAPVSAEISELALSSFTKLLLGQASYDYFVQFLFLCIENMKKNKSVVQCDMIAYYILSSFKGVNIYGKTLQDCLKEISQAQPLIDIILRGCKHYEDIVEKAKPNGEISELIFEGKYKHCTNLTWRFKILETVLQNGGENVKIGNERLLQLWKIYVTECKASYDTQEFLKWISNEKDQINNILSSNIFQPEENIYLFNLICLSRNILSDKLSGYYFKCFAKQFKLVNLTKNAIEIKRGRVKILNYEQVFGIDELWENAIFCNDHIRIKFCDLLIDVYNILSGASYTKRVEIWKLFVNRCMTSIMNANPEKDQIQITNQIKLLILFLDVIDGKKFAGEHTATNIGSSSILVTYKPGINIISICKI